VVLNRTCSMEISKAFVRIDWGGRPTHPLL
jgi:hypothetical protein